VDPTRSFPRVLFGRFAVALAIAVPLIIGGTVGVNAFIDWKVDQIPRVKVKTAESTDAGEPANFLLIGSDTRANVQTPEEREAFGDPSAQTGQRSDTLIVVHVDPDAKTGFLVSFPRDLVVDIPGTGRSKINAAFNTGDPNTAPQRVVDTITQNFGIPIHHYIQIDFQGFKGIVDAMGGVPVYIPAPMRDEKSGFEFFPFAFTPGCYVLDGSAALNYVRSRGMEVYIDDAWRTDPRGDFGRIERQQAFMRRLATEAFRKSVNSPRTALSIADNTIPQLKADESLSSDDVKKFIQAFRGVNPNDTLEMVTFPTVEGPSNTGLGAILEAKEPEAEAVLARLRQLGPPPEQQEGPKPAEIRLRVFNGSGRSGIAGKTQGELQQLGFVTTGVGNKPEVRATEVHYRPGTQDKANVLKSYLGGVGRLVEDARVVDVDVEIVIGRDFQAAAAPAGATPAPAAPAPAPTPTPAPSSAPPTSAGKKGKPAGPPADPTQC
jgi:polyisoprenyl-teichoic acid--peptidoglycan teichoic acid transferase